MFMLISFVKFGKIFNHYLKKYSLSSFLSHLLLRSPWSISWTTWCWPTGSVHFSSIFLLFLRLDNFHCPIFKLTESYFCLLKSAFESLYWIFHLLLSFSVLEFLSGFFSGFLSLYWYYFTLFSFSTSSFSSLSTFRTVDLVWCVCHLDFSQTVSVICVFLWTGRISCSSCPLCLLLLLNSRHLNLIMW